MLKVPKKNKKKKNAKNPIFFLIPRKLDDLGSYARNIGHAYSYYN